MTTFIELHALRSFPPSNLNRDDLGTPKTAVFGGARRLRISSQCLKRTWRMSDNFRGTFAADQLGVRTDRLPDEVLKALGGQLDESSRAGLIALLGSIGKKAAKAKADDDDGDAGEGAGPETEKGGDSNGAERPRTAHLLFLSRQEIEAVADFARKNAGSFAKVFNKRKVDSKAIEKLRKELEEHLRTNTSKNAVDVGLFGRFVTSGEFDTVEGALQVAHALGTQKVEVEYDYFTAVDDLGDTAGAGHLGESEYASSVLYLYACCDLGQLERNLGGRRADSEGRECDAEAQALARKSLPAVVRAMAEATPKGKKTGTAPHTPAEYVEVVVRRGAPLSFANAFIKPIDGREGNGGVMAASIGRLAKHRDVVETAYGRDKDAVARFVLCLADMDGALPSGASVKTIDELALKLGAALDALPAQSQA